MPQHRAPRNTSLSVAVIGGGLSGLTAAATLRALGYTRVTVYEAAPQVGGKVSTFWHEGRPYELGAILTSDRFKLTAALSDALGIERRPISHVTNNFAAPSSPIDDRIDVMLGIVKAEGPLSPVASFAAFTAADADLEAVDAPGLAQVPAELSVPYSEFARQHRIDGAVGGTVKATMTGFGYGYDTEVPASYWWKLIPTAQGMCVDLVTSGHAAKFFPGGWQTLLAALASTLPDVRTGAHVASIRRLGPGAGVEVKPLRGRVEVFDRAIIAGPQNTMALGVLDATPEEAALFRKATTVDYLVTVAESTWTGFTMPLENARADRIGHVTAAFQPWPETNISVFYQFVPPGDTLASVEKTLASDLERMGARLGRVLTRRRWPDYFPHAAPADVAAGYHARLEALQGAGGVYYAGALQNFELTDGVTRYARALVHAYF